MEQLLDLPNDLLGLGTVVSDALAQLLQRLADQRSESHSSTSGAPR
jgi:hypothetical protein